MGGQATYVGHFYPETLAHDILPMGNMKVHSQAAWHFVRCAHLALYEIPTQVVLEGNTDATVRLKEIMDSTEIIYGIDKNEFMKLMPECRRLSFALGRTWNGRLQAFIDSAGRAYNELTREPDALNIS
jgi:hypothetical protein